ncbi:hypothetical protein LOK49_LG13G00117 [Camellia lanceoleosa]|uniref:Uncharacterized protein n=1 Tax=Camellia lanceoleosa TaxID=1840588 RepID=A0ACC0FEU6_9ERIC|nr:hypothetical protein LOK49_LG13G00117 [Camellia lanceoleosa]
MELVQSQCGSWCVYSFCKLCPRPQKTQYVEDSKRRVRNWKNWGLIENHSKKFASLIVNASDGGAEVVVVEKPPKLQRFQVFDGSPTPFGATARDGGVNFAVYSSNALSATLCFMTLSDLHQKRVTEQISMDPMANRTGDVWHVFLKGDFEDMLYGYKFDGKFCPEGGHYYDSSQILLDPYAKDFGVLGPEDDCWPQMACMVPSSNIEFDWEGDLPLKFPQRDLVIYEMHIRGFTRHDSSRTEFPGTYLGVVEKLDHLKELGVNCVELMPCHEFNELEYYCYNSVLDDYKVNFWGYSTINYFSPMIRYSSAGKRDCGSGAINEFKLLVKEAHKRGIEVIMDVVFNHTAEGNEKGPTLSFRGVDNSVFYMLAPKGEFYNYSGCGNTFNCNHPVVRQFILDCLRYWVTEMHVDGFRFDLASILTRGSSLWDALNVYGNPIEGDMLTTGTPLSSPPLIDLISNDPILRGVKLVAEAWDCGGLYQVGMFPHWGIWSEWNGKYRDIVRQYIKGTDGFAGAFAECLCGSPNLYQLGRWKETVEQYQFCVHITMAFSLADLVMYNNKHNLANGEDNNDGENHNNSWNCGQEGEFASIPVKKLRKRQMRNFFLCLMVSQGVPMIYMGDEYGHTKGGNNNTYCHDNYINYFRWDKKEEASSDFFRFCSLMTKFRHHLAVIVTLPERPGYKWEPFVDTSKPAPFDVLSSDLERDMAITQYAHFLDANLYPMLSYSSIILLLFPDNNDNNNNV